MTKISVITPVYKAEKYIERCVRSLMEQTILEDIEFIFVNDCTPDNSMEILYTIISEYPHRKEQIIILNNETNLGPSDSRKRAIDIAKGEYIGCCDSDDWVEIDMYETMYKATNNGNIDIVISDFYYEKNTKQSIHRFTASSTPQDALAKMNNNKYFSYAMWNQIIRRTIIKEQIKYIIATTLREDTFLMMRVYCHAKHIQFIPIPFYHYWIGNETSLCHNVDRSMNAWFKQKENMDSITQLLYSVNYNKFHKGVNLFKYMLKQEYRKTFPNLKTYYYAFRESHSYYVKESNKTCNSFINRLKTKIVWDSFYYFFWLYYRKKSKSSMGKDTSTVLK